MEKNAPHTRSLGVLGLVAACTLTIGCHSEVEGPGGITARLVFDDDPATSRGALLTAAVPEAVGRLEIRALDTSGSTLATTILAIDPAPGENQLIREGGTWTLESVPVGNDRSVVALAFVEGTNTLAYRGRIDGISVSRGTVTNAGTIVLQLDPNAPRELDFTAPSPPGLTVLSADEGEALDVQFTASPEADTAGYVIAVGTSTRTPPSIARSSAVSPGQLLDPNLSIREVRVSAPAQPIRIPGLADDVVYTVAVYAFDTDSRGQPLNFSAPAFDLETIRDLVEPGPPGNLMAFRDPTGGVRVRFISPGEDGSDGTVDRYEVRASTVSIALEEDTFADLPALPAPAPVAGGTLVDYLIGQADFGLNVAGTFFVGVRGVDASERPGPIEIAEGMDAPPEPPVIAPETPAIAVAGLPMNINGEAFGAVSSTVTLTATETSTRALPVTIDSWQATQVRVTIPVDARTGILRLTRADGAFAEHSLSVLTVVDDAVPAADPPFELIGTADPDAPSVAALYLEQGNFSPPFDAEIRRLYGETDEAIAFVPLSVERSTAVAGTFAPQYDRFFFVGGGAAATEMTTAHLTSVEGDAPADAGRLNAGVAAGGADGIGAVLLDGGAGGAIPALVAFTTGGALRVAAVGNARTDTFANFTQTDPPLGSAFEGATLAREESGSMLIAHRTVTGTVATLSLLENVTGIPATDFSAVAGTPPRMPETEGRLRVLTVPSTVGGTIETFYLVYEHQPPGEPIRIRILPRDDYGLTPGYAPFAVDGLRLEDAGLTIHRNQIRLAIAATSEDAGRALYYTEISFADLQTPRPDGGHPGISVDTLPDDEAARLGCKPYPQRACPMLLLSNNVQRLFLRQ